MGDVPASFRSPCAIQTLPKEVADPSPTDPFHLFLMLKDLKAIVGKN
jgi:hypothetical protein